MGFKTVRRLGIGGSGVVYEVRDKKGFSFAFKHIVRHSVEDDRYIDQAVREHQVAQHFDHPTLRKSLKVIRRYELGSFAEMAKYRSPVVTAELGIIMELVVGETMDRHPINDLTEMCRLLLEVSFGLSTMHKAGFIHGDLKPINLMFTSTGHIKIIDLGLASPIGIAKQRIHGTPGFIAPEQVQLKPLTPRTDVFCFGATMYKMLTGKSVPSVLRERTKSKPIIAISTKYEEDECPTPRTLNPAIPPALSQLIMDCIRHRVEDRPENLTIVSDRLWLAIGQMEREKPPTA